MRRPYIAQSAIEPGTGVVQGTAENQVKAPGAGGAGDFVGVYPWEANEAKEAGDAVGIELTDIVKVLAGGNVTAGKKAALKADTSGTFVNAATVEGQHPTCGTFLQSGAAGEYVDMIVERSVITIPLVTVDEVRDVRAYEAESAIMIGTGVVQGTAENQVKAPGAGGEGDFIGVYSYELARDDVAADDLVEILVSGIGKVKAGGEVTAGKRAALKADTSGTFVNVATAVGTYETCGTFLQSGSAGEYVDMIVERGSVTVPAA